MRVIATGVIDPGIGLHHSDPIICAERLCTIQVRVESDVEPNLTNTPLFGSRSDVEVLRLGEVFQIDCLSGEFRIERLSGEASALVIRRVAGNLGRPFWSGD
jgi:hypothetical protein